MKYFTKEWYELCQKTDAHLLLEKSKEAERFSEEFYQALYQQKLNEYLAMQKEISSASVEELFPAELDEETFEGMTENEIKKFKIAYYADCEEAIKNYKPEPYEPELLTQQFREVQAYNIERAKKVLPEEILSQIADIHVFVLDKASKKVIHKVKAYCVMNERVMEKTIRDYQEYIKSVTEKIDQEILDEMALHDCKIECVTPQEDSLEIVFDNGGGFTDINRVRFENYNITKQDGSLENKWWLYEEIYQIDNGYEIHVLLADFNLEENELIDFIIQTKRVIFFRDKEE